MTLRAAILTVALASLRITAIAAPPIDASPPRRAEDAYVLGSGDLVEVAVLGQPEFTTRAKIRSDGSIALPFLNSVPVAGLTVISCAADIAERLISGGYYKRPVVSVEIAGYASRTITVLGEVALPGIVPIDRAYHLSEIIARSGGLRESGADYVLLRHLDAPEQRIRYAQLGSGDPNTDPMVEPGDKIFVPVAPTFSIYGQVNAAGNFPLKGVMTLRNAIARAGGLRENGSEGRAKLIRDGKQLRLNRLTEIKPNDVIIIGERLF